MAAAREGNLDALKVKFTHSNTVRDKKPYTIYEIEVRSSSTITWVIYKRYNDFFTLHQQLTKWKEAASASSPNSSVAQLVLPTLPPKRLTRSLAVEFVEKRKAELQEYLREVLASPGLQRTEVVLNFLEVPDSVRPMLARGSANPDASSDSDARDGLGDGKDSLYNTRNYQHRSPDERKVLDLLNSLGFSRNKVSAIKVFEDWFFELKPRLPPDCIRTLFQGEPVGDLEGGLVQACGDFKYSHVASRAALDLLVRLLDVEKNKDAQSFLDVFCTLELASLQRMQLHLHILSERGNRLGAFKLVSTLKSKLNDTIVEKVVSDPYARQEYFRWAERKSESITPALSEPQETAMRAVNLAEVGHRKVSEQAFQDILAIAHNEQGWRVVRFHRLPSELCLKQMPRPSSGSVASPPPPEPADASSMRLTFKIDQRRDIVIVRASAALPFSVDTVTKFLLEIPRRTDWDIMFHRGKRVDKLDSTSDVVHFVFKSFCSPFKYRDFCLLRAWTKLESGGRIIATRSVMHPKLPEQKDHVRAVLLPTGYMVTPLEDGPSDSKDSRGGCLLTFVGQFDKDSVLIVSPDLLGETNMLYQSFENLKLCLQAQGPAAPAPSPKGAGPSTNGSGALSPRASPTPLSAQQSPSPAPPNKIAGITAMFGKK